MALVAMPGTENEINRIASARLSVHITVSDGQKALDFYQNALGAKLLEAHFVGKAETRMLQHATMIVNGATFHLSDEVAGASPSPTKLGGSSVTIALGVRDSDKSHARAVKAGARSVVEPSSQFFGVRFSKVTDPFGHHWSFSTPEKKMTIEQVHVAGAAALGQKLPR